MKTLKTMALLASMLMLAPAFTGCGNDDDDDDLKPADISKITGTYAGELGWQVMTVEGTFEGEYEVQILRDANDADDVTVILPECMFTRPGATEAHTSPSIKITDVDVSEAGNVYTISEDDFDMAGFDKPGSLSGTIAGRNIKLQCTMQPGTMPMPITLNFTGTLKD